MYISDQRNYSKKVTDDERASSACHLFCLIYLHHDLNKFPFLVQQSQLDLVM